MKFALGGNHNENNTQTANKLIADILDESLYAEEVGRYSALDRNLPYGRRAIDRDTRRHPAAMAEMQKLLNGLIASTHDLWRISVLRWRKVAKARLRIVTSSRPL